MIARLRAVARRAKLCAREARVLADGEEQTLMRKEKQQSKFDGQLAQALWGRLGTQLWNVMKLTLGISNP